MTSQWPQDLWPKLDKVIRDESFVSANEIFTDLKNAILKSSPEELATQSANAALTWEFLLGFAAKKPFYRSHVCQVVKVLLSAPGAWRQAYASSEELRSKSAHVHADIQEALKTAGEEASAAVAAVPSIPASIPPVAAKNIDWPDWEAISTAVLTERSTGATMGAVDEFSALRAAVRVAGPVELASQVGHAPDVWRFLVGVGEKKAIYRSQIAEVVGILREEEGWERALKTAMPEMRARVEALPDVIKEALGMETCWEVVVGADAPLQKAEVPEQADPKPDDPGTPGYSSLEEKLSSMLGVVADLAGPECTGDDRAKTQDVNPNPHGSAGMSTSSLSMEDRLGSMLGQDTKQSDKDPWSWHSPHEAKNTLEGEEGAHQRDADRPHAAGYQAETPRPPLPQSGREGATVYLEEAGAIEARQPMAAHYLRVHAIELLIRAKTPGSDPLLQQVFLDAESKKAALDLTNGPAAMEAFALRAFENALNSERAGADSSKLTVQLRSACLLLGALAQFHNDGALPAGLAEKLAYAQACYAKPSTPASLPAAPQPSRTCATAAHAEPAAYSAPAAPAAPAAQAAHAGPAALAATAAPAVPSGPAAGQISSLSIAKRQKEAKKKSEQAAKALSSKDVSKARSLIVEALALIEGLA
eukprot:TRINITY_DN33407_c0_g1_i1.p1 TRINITY_DN33407_c0_g1~~TRINITY_DN33407_c0_g1_i1.p1  ORF type:complete len:646 (+),score=149.10 TRINITY_DN33407_c0_g1_i1:73-2010(+)